MIAIITFEWNRAFSPSEQDLLTKLSDRPIVWEDMKDEKLPHHKRLEYSRRDFTMAIEDAAQFGEFTVRRLVTKGVASQLDEVINHLKKLNPQPAFNERVNVSVPGEGLLRIAELKLEEDCCTDTANAILTEGWRIVAICPQPDKRRPDYVFGRSAKNE